MSSMYNKLSEVKFLVTVFKKMKTITYKKTFEELDGDDADHFYLKDVEAWNVFDPIRYNKAEL